MKSLIITLCFSCCLLVSAQSSPLSTLRSRITDDGKILSIRLDGFQRGRTIHYNQTFDIAGMNNLQKQMLKYRAFRSQGMFLPLQEMTELVLIAVGLLAFMLTLIVVHFQRRKAILMNPVNA